MHDVLQKILALPRLRLLCPWSDCRATSNIEDDYINQPYADRDFDRLRTFPYIDFHLQCLKRPAVNLHRRIRGAFYDSAIPDLYYPRP